MLLGFEPLETRKALSKALAIAINGGHTSAITQAMFDVKLETNDESNATRGCAEAKIPDMT